MTDRRLEGGDLRVEPPLDNTRVETLDPQDPQSLPSLDSKLRAPGTDDPRRCDSLRRCVLAVLLPLVMSGAVLAREGECDRMGLLGQRPGEAGATPGRRFGVILNGDRQIHHVENALQAYESLLANGFDEEDMYLLSVDCCQPSYDDGVPIPVNDGHLTLQNLQHLFVYLKERVTSRDTLVIYATGHGGLDEALDPPQATLMLYDGLPSRIGHDPPPGLSVRTFAKLLEGLEPALGLIVFDQCFGKGFADVLGHGAFACVALSDTLEEVYCQNFSPLFWELVRRSGVERQRGRSPSLETAFEEARQYSLASEDAQKPVLISDFTLEGVHLWDVPRRPERLSREERLEQTEDRVTGWVKDRVRESLARPSSRPPAPADPPYRRFKQVELE